MKDDNERVFLAAAHSRGNPSLKQAQPSRWSDARYANLNIFKINDADESPEA